MMFPGTGLFVRRIYGGRGVRLQRCPWLAGVGFERIFENAAGRAGNLVITQQLAANKEMWSFRLDSIYRYNVGHITFNIMADLPWELWSAVGYEEYGKILLLLTGDRQNPNDSVERIIDSMRTPEYRKGWFFIGEKKEGRPQTVYRDIIDKRPNCSPVKMRNTAGL